MPNAAYQFPAGFLWGTATAAHQVEGNNTNNNWYAWEQQEGRIIHGQHSNLACDWWGGRWKEDFDRAAATHQNSHRLSVEWSRIQPQPDRWDEHALDYYREMLRGALERGITPMVTLHHFTDPIWLTERGGWENDETPQLFNTFVRKVVEALHEYVNLWVTINEPNVYTYGGYLGTVFPPGKTDRVAAAHVMVNMIRGHALAYKTIHTLQRTARVGIAINYRSFRPFRDWSPFDGIPSKWVSRFYNDAIPNALHNGVFSFLFKSVRIPEAANTQDFIGVNYYTGDLVSFDLSRPGELFSKRFYPSNAELSDTGFIAHYPDGMSESLKWASRFNLPILVTENGVEDIDDHLRPRYLIEHLHRIWKAINNNWQIKGYYHWSLVDNFEWERGWTQRFGLWGLDVDTQIRIRRPSVDLYAAICKENALTSDMVTRYVPDLAGTLFPG